MKNYKYDGSRRFSIRKFDCADTGEFRNRHEAVGEFVQNLEEINEYQQKLFAEQKEGIIFVFQAMDAAGKDGAVRAVLSCLSPQGVSEHSFKVPSAEENRHDYLWRFWSAIPGKGSISIFNRSYYEDVLVQKVHSLYKKNKYADRIDPDKLIDGRYEQIRNFEKYLWDNSIRVIKIFLNVSKDEQARRFLSRIDTQKKNWKFSSSDIDERAYWDEYMDAYETCINRTARKNTPWYVVPADHKWYARLIISRIIVEELKNMDPKWPVLGDEEMAKLNKYREMLTEEEVPEKEKEEEVSTWDDIKPADTAIGIALRSDRYALSEKKFQKQLKKSVFENFSERFGVSEQTQEELGRIYLTFEEMEAKAEEDELCAIKALYNEKKNLIKEKVSGCGKEARKLYEHYKRDGKNVIKSFTETINTGYASYEDELKQYMAEYEMAVGTQDTQPEAAILEYNANVNEAYKAHRAESEKNLNKYLAQLEELAGRYYDIGLAFKVERERKEAEEDKILQQIEAMYEGEEDEQSELLDQLLDAVVEADAEDKA